MRNLRRRAVILAVVTGLFGCAQNPTSFKPNSEPDGFAGIKWGTQFSEVKSETVESRSVSNPTEPDVKTKIYYTKKDDNFRMGDVQLDKKEYGFWKGKFAEVQITTTGPDNFSQLKKFLFEKYGTVDKAVQGVYSWDGSITQMALRYEESTKTSSLTIASTKILNKALHEMIDQD